MDGLVNMPQVHPAVPVCETYVVLAGTWSTIITTVPPAVAGPLLVIVCVHVMFCPAFTGLGLHELVTARSASVLLATATVAVAELSFGFVSWVVAATVAVSVISVPAGTAAPTVTFTVNVLLDPGATLGFEQLIEPVVVQVHPVGTGVSETKVVLVGNASVKVAPRQLLGPVFVTTWV